MSKVKFYQGTTIPDYGNQPGELYFSTTGEGLWLSVPNPEDISNPDMCQIALGDQDAVLKSGDTMKGALTVKSTVTATSFYESSDRSLKERITDISDSEKAQNIELKEFYFKNDLDKIKKYGVIAQQLEEVGLDNLVITSGDGMKSVDYISMLVLLVNELRDEVKDLKSEIEVLKNK